MSSQIKGALTAGAAAVSAAAQCVLGFTAFGGRLGVERTLIIGASAVAAMIAVAFWSVTSEGDVRRRRLAGSIGLVAVVALAVTALWATFTYHDILAESRRVGHETITTFRGPITPVDVEVEFYTEPVSFPRFAGYGGSALKGKARIERFSETKFALHRLSSSDIVVLHHVSASPLAFHVDSDEAAGRTTTQAIRWNTLMAALAGGILCGGGVLFVWWLTSLQRQSQGSPPQPIGFRIGER